MKYSTLAVLRKEKVREDQSYPVYVYVYEGGVLKKKIPIGHKVHADFWNKETRRVEPKFKNATLINSLINKTISEWDIKILEDKIAPTNDNIFVTINKQAFKNMDFYAFCEGQIKMKDYAPETRRNYTVYLDKIKAFRKTLRISEVNYQFLISYEAYLRDELENEHNTVWGNLKFINTMTNDAIKSKFLSEDPFETYKRPKYKQTVRSFLIGSEVEKVEDFLRTTADEGLLKVGMYFLFMAYTGLRFSDAIRFRIADHVIDGERIVIETQKTKKITNLFINNKIAGKIDYINDNRLKLTQTDFNRKIKLIAAYCGINKKVSSHVARHSFGASLAAKGVPEKHAQGLMAHGSASSTKIYYHLQNVSLDEGMKKLD